MFGGLVFQWRSFRTSGLDFRRIAGISRGSMYRFSNSRIGSAAAQITAHGLIDVRIGGICLAREQRGGRHNLPRLAVAALRYIDFDPSPLHRMTHIRRKTFDRGDVLAGNARNRCAARSSRHSVDVYGTCAAKLQAATKFGARQAQRVPQNPKQRHLSRDVDASSFPVEGEINGWHLDSS